MMLIVIYKEMLKNGKSQMKMLLNKYKNSKKIRNLIKNLS